MHGQKYSNRCVKNFTLWLYLIYIYICIYCAAEAAAVARTCTASCIMSPPCDNSRMASPKISRTALGEESRCDEIRSLLLRLGLRRLWWWCRRRRCWLELLLLAWSRSRLVGSTSLSWSSCSRRMGSKSLLARRCGMRMLRAALAKLKGSAEEEEEAQHAVSDDDEEVFSTFTSMVGNMMPCCCSLPPPP